MGDYSKKCKVETIKQPPFGYMAVFNRIKLGEPDSDCGTDRTIAIKLDKDNYKSFLYSNIDDNGTIVNLTEDNIDKYIDKTVNMYSVLYCVGDKICNKCAGESFKKLGMDYVDVPNMSVSNMLKLFKEDN